MMDLKTIDSSTLKKIESRILDDTPHTWVKTTLGNCFKWGSGGTPKSGVSDYYDGDIPWLVIGDLNDGVITTSGQTITEEGLANSSAKLVKPGTLLLAMYGSIGKLGIAGIKLATNQAIAFALENEINTKYLFNFLRFVRPYLNELGKGATQQNISQTIIKAFPFPLAPIDEQKRIVAKIEELFSELDNAINALNTARKQLKMYRQSVLKHAFEGKITAKWRKENADTLETQEQLLARIQQERDIRYQRQLEEWKAAVKKWEMRGKNEKKPGKPRNPTEIKESIQSLPKLPNGWLWLYFGDLVIIASNLVSPTDFPDLPHIAPDNIERDTGKLLSYRTVSEDEITSPKHYFFAGQILYSKIRPNLSKLALIDFNGLCSADMYPLESEYYDHSFLKYLMLTKNFVTQSSTAGSRSVLPKINQAELSKLTIPFCHISEQIRVVNYLEESLSFIEKISQDIELQLSRTEILRQSILKKAFSGKLLPQDPNDEPAGELLMRIKAIKSIMNGK